MVTNWSWIFEELRELGLRGDRILIFWVTSLIEIHFLNKNLNITVFLLYIIILILKIIKWVAAPLSKLLISHSNLRRLLLFKEFTNRRELWLRILSQLRRKLFYKTSIIRYLFNANLLDYTWYITISCL